MSAEIIDLCAWRREHRPVEHAPVKIPLLVPTWPWGWLLPVLIEMTIDH
jgi:hypothetical protein